MYNRLEVLKGALGTAGWQPDALQDPREALTRLQTGDYGAVFCDEILRGASPRGFLAWTRRKSAELPFYLIEGVGGDSRGFSGVTALVSFPPRMSDLPKPSPGEGAQTPPRQDAREACGESAPLVGNTSLVPLSQLLEMMGLAGQQGRIVVQGGGVIYLKGSTLVHAEAEATSGSLVGLPALSALVALEETDFRVEIFRAPARATVNLPVANALTKAARLADERKRFEGLMDAVRGGCPAVTAGAGGYLLSPTPLFEYGTQAGEVGQLFELCKRLVAQNRELLGDKVSGLHLVTDAGAVALRVLGGDNVLVVQAPPEASASLFRALEAAASGLQEA